MQRVVCTWNELPEKVVEAGSNNRFKHLKSIWISTCIGKD